MVFPGRFSGKDITDAAGDIDFDVTVGADAGKSIPVDVINNVTGEHSSLNLTLAYDGEFGFTATLTVNMESKNAGLYANLFYYNEQTGELEFISAGQIDPDGNVRRRFMEENPGPALYREVQKMDPGRPIIKVLSAKMIRLAGTATIIWVL